MIIRRCFVCGWTGCSEKHEIDAKTRIFIEKARKKHGYRYDYSLVKYKTNKGKIPIICCIHGKFEQSASHHYNREQNCPKCVNQSPEQAKENFYNRIKY